MIDLSALVPFGWKPFFQQQLSLDELDTLEPMRVTEVQRTLIRAMTNEGIRDVDYGHAERWSEHLTVGDWILARNLGTQAYLARVLERQNGLMRKAAGSAVAEQWMAANLDAVFLVLACDQTFSLSRLERYLAVVRQARIEPVIVLTKADLHPDPHELLQQLPREYIAVALDARAAAKASELAPYVGSGRTIAMLGTSGVGKSTLVNALLGREVQDTGAVRTGDARGRHTTTSRQLLLLPGGGAIIDTPGIRELAMPGGDDAEGEFADIAALATQCRFADCVHQGEPGCAVAAAIERGDFDARRLANFRKLARERAWNERELMAHHQVKAVRRKWATRVKSSIKTKLARRDGAVGERDRGERE